MSEEVSKEQTKDATQEKTTELSDGRLDEAAGGAVYMQLPRVEEELPERNWEEEGWVLESGVSKVPPKKG